MIVSEKCLIRECQACPYDRRACSCTCHGNGTPPSGGTNVSAARPMTPTDLALVSTDALLQELLGRYDHAVFAGLSHRSGETHAGKRVWTAEAASNGLAEIGLAYNLAHAIQKAHEQRTTPIDGRDT